MPPIAATKGYVVNIPAPRSAWKKVKNPFLKKVKGASAKMIAKLVDDRILNNKAVEVKRQRFADNTALTSGTMRFYNLLQSNTQGDDDLGNHIGDKITLKSIRIRGNLPPIGTSDIIRVIIFHWKLLSSTTPTELNLLDDTVSTQNKIFGDIAYDNTNSKKVFSILSDKVYTPSTATGQLRLDYKHNWASGYNIQFDAATATGYGFPFMAIISNGAHVPTFYSTIKYVDM